LLPNVLLVTYERSMAPIYSEALTNMGFNVSWSCDEDRAISYFAQRGYHPDLVVIDHMPAIMNGVLAMMEMRRIDPSARIVLMGENNRVRGFAVHQGATAFVKKPASVEKFLCMVEKYARAGGRQAYKSARERTNGAPEKGVVAGGDRPLTKERLAASQIHYRRTRHRKHPVVMGILFLAMIAPILIGASAFTDLQASQAMIAVLVYSNHSMEDKSFELFIDDNLQASGHTGAGNYVRMILPYTWGSFGSATVHISAVSSSSDVPSQSTETLVVSPGGVYIVNIYI
jgi:DNA-binding response OmpR family regulator